ncbi:MAG: MerR family transcriptional regulator [Acidobacteria bacterium]|nr:MerR family transcriptional regulator [Acidobacteriota bacterium]MCA1610318.1 MerR family transcriptional regulator [Acidobacteriota bacterium]MCA1617285.1 MerR family transcriptional regulator [Acidobacteriota bacterium]
MKKTSEPAFPIGAVSRATGFSPDILRVWQKRYGFPVPGRKPSGHRLYSAGDIRRLRQISRAISRGHRPSQVVALPERELENLLAEEAASTSREPPAARPIAALLDHVSKHRREELSAALLADASALGPIAFLTHRIAPLAEAVGEAWAKGELSIHHEHFFSECAEDVLRGIRLPYERAARGPVILLATLSGETHRLGLQMAALVTAAAGLRPHVLGSDTPVREIADAWVLRNASAIGLSISISTGGASAHRELEALRRAVPSHVPIFAGGKGARRSHPPAGVAVVEDFERLADWLRSLRTARSA